MHSPFELLTASTALTVVRLKARERLNQPTRVDLTLDTNEVADLRLGSKASVAIHGSPLGARFFHGIVTRVGRGQTRTDVRVEARLARLRGRKTHRIFHDCSHLEVVKRLLEEHGTYVGPGHWFEMPDTHFRLGYGWPTADELTGGLAAISKALRG